MDPQPRTQIFLRPIGSPVTVAMSGLAIGSFVQSGLSLGWVSPGQTLYVGLILISVALLLQLIACLLCYLARDGATGAAVGVLSTTWLALGLIHVVSRSSSVSGAVGLLLVMSATTLALSSLVVSSAKPLVALVFALAAARFAAAGTYELSGVAFWRDVAGIIGLMAVAASAHCVIAFELEGQAHRAVLPTFRRGQGEDAVSGSVAARLDGVTDEPGVRQTT